MKIPGITARHAIITPNCRTVPRPHLNTDPQMAAFDEAVNRLREEYQVICSVRGDKWNGHLVLSIEGPHNGG